MKLLGGTLRNLSEIALRFSNRMTKGYKGVIRPSVGDHKKVSNAILAGDDAEAEMAMRKIIQGALELIVRADQTALADERSRRRVPAQKIRSTGRFYVLRSRQ